MHNIGGEHQNFKLGSQVEVTRNKDGWRNSFYKATIIHLPKQKKSSIKWKNNDFCVEHDTILYDDNPSKKLQDYIDILSIRPLPPIPKNTNFHKYDYVDAYRNNGWFTGVILDIFNNGFKYLVAFLHPYEEFVYERAQLRVHLEWSGYGVDGNKFPEWHGPKKVRVSFCAPNVGEAVEGSLLESTHAMVGTGEPTPSPAKKLKETTSGNAKGRGSSEMNDAEKVNRVSQVDEPEKVIYEQGDCQSKAPVSYPEPATTECPKTCPITICFSRQLDKSQGWPFTKRSNMWKVIESMEVFKRVPQMPHFSPLNQLEENSREMIAISMMMKFSYVAERISAGSPNDLNSPTIIQDTLKTLDELESHGFNTTPLHIYVNDRLEKMSMEKELKGNLEEVDHEIRKSQDDKESLERNLNELAEQMKSLEEQIKSKKSDMHLKDLQLANLESQRDIISRKLDTLQLTKKPAFEW